ncbi:internal scaffolding protein [Blackfly microvirus SF02]|uniref:Internal scaffolding protein n=1 Tax=Blackfly microvirus SF02 TaxID=2576452 RepID=A0A4P8PJR3_9VIRU|nr:internal scaffolding protein [Blackfly microvirus SF02]
MSDPGNREDGVFFEPYCNEQGHLLYDQQRPTFAVHPPVEGGVSMTRQEFAAESDINNIMAQYDGQWPPPPNGYVPQYLDFSNVPDLMTAHAISTAAAAAFMTLPARVRAEFENDPMKFVDYASNPDNLDQMRAWKLAPPAAAPAPSPGPGDVSAPPPVSGGDAS